MIDREKADPCGRRICIGAECQHIRTSESYYGRACVGRSNGKIEMIIDGGSVDIGLESTILDMTVSPPMILRPGAIAADMLEEVIGVVERG